MAGLLDLLSGRSSDIYGNGLLTPEQRGGLGNIGLLALAGKLGQLAGPSFSPVPDFGAALGQAAGAYGASQEGAGTAALNAILTGQKGRKLEQELDYYKQLGPVLQKLGGQWPGADGGTAATPETGSTGSTGGGAAAPPGAGGGGGDAPAIPQSEAVDKARYYARLYGVPEDMFLHQINGENGFKASGTSSAGAQGIAQFMPGTAKQYGVNVANVDSSLDGAARYMRDLYKQTGSWEGALRSYLGAKSDATLAPILASNKPYAAAFAAARGGGAPAAAPTAATPAGGGGLLAPTAPNPLSDADPMLPIARPTAPTAAPGAGAAAVAPNQVGRFAGIAPGTPVNSRGFPYNPEITDPAVAARVAQSMAAIKQAQQSGTPWYQPREGSGGGGPLAAPPDAGGDPIMSVTSADQAGGGDAPGGTAPRSPLPTMGPAGIELPPMQGPLATPAPAAAAPAAAGPGLLSPPGAAPPGAPPIPRGANPAFDAYLRNLATAGTLAEGAGLKNVFGPMIDALKASPSFQAELERARKTIELQYAPALKEAEKGVELRYAEPLAAATGRGQLPSKVAELEVKSRLDNLAAGRIWDADKGQFVSPPGYVDTLKEQERAKAEGSKSQDTTEVMVRGADGRDYKQMIPQTDLAQKLREQPPAIPGQPVPPGTIVGARQAGPLDTLGIETLKEAGVAAQGAYKRIQDYGQLAQAAQAFTSGPTTEKWFEVKKYLKDLGVISGTEVPDQEIFQLAQRRLQAAAAPKGQGSTSDYERSLFSSGLASMATSKEGLARAIAIANRLDQYDVQVAQIHEDVARQNRGYPDYLAVQQRLRELGPPLSEGEKAALTAVSSRATPSAVSPAAPAAGAQPAPAGSIRTPYGTITPRQ